jgi:hypothetical protein
LTNRLDSPISPPLHTRSGGWMAVVTVPLPAIGVIARRVAVGSQPPPREASVLSLAKADSSA